MLESLKQKLKPECAIPDEEVVLLFERIEQTHADLSRLIVEAVHMPAAASWLASWLVRQADPELRKMGMVLPRLAKELKEEEEREAQPRVSNTTITVNGNTEQVIAQATLGH